jgi:tetratricopeptide (TPR) repeat protein
LALVDASLVRMMDQRFVMLETVRDFAFKRLVESGTFEQVRRRHAAYLLALAERARPFARGPRERDWLDRLLSEMDNIRAALSFALDLEDAALGLALAEQLEPLWIRGERQREALRWLEPLLRLEGDVDPRIRAGALALAGRAALETGDIERARPWSEAAVDVARSSGDDLRTAWALHGLGHLRAELGDLDSARVLFEESLELFLRLGEHAPASGRLTFLAYYAQRQGDVERARALYLQAAEQYRLAGDDSGVGDCIYSVGDLAREQGDVATAIDRFSEAQPLILRGGAPFDLALAVGGIAAVAALRGRRSDAGQLSGAFERLIAESERHLEPQDRWR